MPSLKERTISGMLWSSVQRFGTMLISFGVNLVLARLLTPEDFGIIGMLMVFIALSDTLINGGFASALIQKKDPTDLDYSTVFYWNLAASVLLFGLLFVAAPWIADFYGIPLLSTVLRIQGVVLIFNAFSLIQHNQLIKQLNFRQLAKVNVGSTLLGAVVGITMAVMGYGVWSLVAKLLVQAFAQSVLFWISSSWRPLLAFSWVSFRGLFRFGSFILLSNFVEKAYQNIQALIIGRVFSAGDLGYYTQAKRLQDVPTTSLSAVVNQVSFPVFSEMANDLQRLKKGVKKNIKAVTFLNFPLMALLLVIARPLIILLFGEKWVESVPLFQILCILAMLYTLNTVNTNIYKSLGKSSLFLYVQFTKRIIGLVLIVVGLQYGLMGMMWGIAASAYISFFINGIVTGRVLGYGLGEQLKDVGLAYLLSLLAGTAVYLLGEMLEMHYVLTLLLQIALYGGLYLGVARVFGMEGLQIYTEVAKSRLGNRSK